MSVQAMTRVMSDSHMTGPARFVLVVIANHETEERGAFPSIETIARETALSLRSVQRHIRTATEAGELEVSLGAGPRGTNLYRTLPELSPRQAVTPDNPGHELSPELKEPVVTLSTSNLRLSVSDLSFDAFWSTYPRKVGKPKARAAFTRACRRSSAEEVLAGAMRYAADLNRDDEFTAHPTTWLNRDGWNDDALPARSNGKVDKAALLLSRIGEVKRERDPGSGSSGALASGLP